MRADFIKDRYDFELDRKDKLTAALALPVGVLGVVGSAGVAMIRTFTYIDPTLSALFIAFLTAAVVAFTSCLSFLAAAFLAQTYVYLPLIGEMKKFEDEMMEYAHIMAAGYEEAQHDCDREFERRIIAAADANTLSNDRRSRWLHWSRGALLVTIALTYLAGFAYVGDQVRYAMPTPDTQKPAPATATTQASTLERPQFPPNRIIKEGREPGSVEKK